MNRAHGQFSQRTVVNGFPRHTSLLRLCLAVLFLPGIAPLTSRAEPVAAPPSKGEKFIYKHVPEQPLTAEILRPPGATPGERRPAIVFYHGGSWTGGSPAQLSRQAAHFAERGLVSILIKYRLLDKETNDPPLVCIQDAKSAIRWIRTHSATLGVDPDRIIAAGASAGGHLATFAALGTGFDDAADDTSVPTTVQALVLFNPVFDNSPGKWGHVRVGDAWQEYSPMQMVRPGTPPTIVLLGSKDPILPSVLEFEQRMEAAGSRCVIKIYEGQGHSFFNYRRGENPYYDQTLKAVDDFLVELGYLAPIAAPL